MYQTKIKRLLAFSAIANLGYILLGLCTISFLGTFASMYYFYIYILSLIQIFSIIIVIRHNISYLKIKNLVEFSSLIMQILFQVFY
jgi:NADH-quinone oxidoreductase subunit N